MKELVTKTGEEMEFLSDLNNNWERMVSECVWPMTKEHFEELYDCFKISEVTNVICLRLFASSIYEIANGPPDSRKLMFAMFGEMLVQQIYDYDIHVFEAIEQTCKYLAWKIRKSQILAIRRLSPVHKWPSVRHVYVGILGKNSEDEKIIAGMAAHILQDVARGNCKEENAVLRRDRFACVFRVAFRIFNDSIGERLQTRKAEIMYETIASRLVSFYVRLAADTWRILVTRNGPKEATEMFTMRSYLLPPAPIQLKMELKTVGEQKNEREIKKNGTFGAQKPLTKSLALRNSNFNAC